MGRVTLVIAVVETVTDLLLVKMLQIIVRTIVRNKGKNAEEYDWPGEIPVTEWLAGSFQVTIE